MNRKLFVLPVMAVLCLASTALAQNAATSAAPTDVAKVEIQPFIGYRWGGGFDIDDPEAPQFDIASGDSYGLTVGWVTGPTSQIDFLYSHQGTDLEVDGSIPGYGDSLSGFDINNFQLEGSYMGGTPEDKFRGFGSFGLGATQFSAPSGFSGSRTQFALSIGGGAKVYLSKTVGLRFQGRWTPTFFNSNETVFCNSGSGCFATTSGDYVSQFELTAGLILRF